MTSPGSSSDATGAGTDGADGEVDVLLDGLREFTAGLDRYRHTLAAELQMGLPELVTVAQLLHTEPMRSGEIGDRNNLTPGSVTALLDRLERRGYISRHRPADNRRVVLVYLTAAGREVGQDMLRPVLPLLREAAGEPGADLAGLAAGLHRMARTLNDLAGDAGKPTSS